MSGIRRWLARLGLAGIALAVAFPFSWALVASLTADARLLEAPVVPSGLVLDHYRALFEQRGSGGGFWVPIRNSLIVALNTTLLCVVLGSLCAYALARVPFRGRAVVLAIVLAVTMFPQVAIVSPLYLALRELRLINTYPGLVLPYLTFAMPLAVWLLVGYFRQLPAELEAAARVDGAGRLRVFWEVMLPLSLPGIAATAAVTLIYCWNEFLFALAFTLGPELHTVPVALALSRGQDQAPWGQILAAAVVATVPVAVLVLAFQRRIVQGLTAGAVKGGG